MNPEDYKMPGNDVEIATAQLKDAFFEEREKYFERVFHLLFSPEVLDAVQILRNLDEGNMFNEFGNFLRELDMITFQDPLSRDEGLGFAVRSCVTLPNTTQRSEIARCLLKYENGKITCAMVFMPPPEEGTFFNANYPACRKFMLRVARLALRSATQRATKGIPEQGGGSGVE